MEVAGRDRGMTAVGFSQQQVMAAQGFWVGDALLGFRSADVSGRAMPVSTRSEVGG